MLQKKLLLSIAIILIVIWSIGPLYWMVNLSFQSRLDIVTIPAHLYPPNPTFQNYRVIIEHLVPVIDQEEIDTKLKKIYSKLFFVRREKFLLMSYLMSYVFLKPFFW